VTNTDGSGFEEHQGPRADPEHRNAYLLKAETGLLQGHDVISSVMFKGGSHLVGDD
jgi:hypothetical protein